MKKILVIITILFNLVACIKNNNEISIDNLLFKAGDKFEKVYEYSNNETFKVYCFSIAMFSIDNFNYVVYGEDKLVNNEIVEVIDEIYVFPAVYPKYKDLKKIKCGMEVYELVELLGMPISVSTGLESNPAKYMAFKVYDEFNIPITTKVLIQTNKVC